MNRNPDGNRDRTIRDRIVRIAAAIVLLICILCLMWQCSGTTAREGASITDFEDMTRDEIQAELDRIVQENMMTISVAPTARLSPDGELRVNVINREDNRFGQRFTVIQNDRELYRSGIIEPGNAVEYCSAPEAEPGDAQIEIQAIDLETSQEHGSPTCVEIAIVAEDEN